MFFVSEISSTAPEQYRTPLQEMTYAALQELDIPFQRVETDEAIGMEDCVQIDRKLQMKMVKTLFLCNRQQTAFYLLITVADKPFRAKELSAALNLSRLSFAPRERLEAMLGVTVGAATVFGVLLDKEQRIQVIVDRDLLAEQWYGCSDGTTTGYMKIRTASIIDDFLPYARHIPCIVAM